jgi:predicted membrane channel-forming protein YqfA (hemolysin III family)
MGPRTRKFIGAAVMIGFVVVYALVAMALSQARPVQEAPGLVQALIYMVIGMSWVIPMLPLIKWMEGRKT